MANPSSFSRKEWVATRYRPTRWLSNWTSIWSALGSENELPGRQKLDPAAISPKLLQWIFMLDVIRATKGLDYQYRLVETANAGLVGRDPTNQLASEIFGFKERRFLMNTFDVTVQEKAPTFWHAEFPQDDYGTIRIDRGLFPLSDNGNDVNMLVCIAVKKNPALVSCRALGTNKS